MNPGGQDVFSGVFLGSEYPYLKGLYEFGLQHGVGGRASFGDEINDLP